MKKNHVNKSIRLNGHTFARSWQILLSEFGTVVVLISHMPSKLVFLPPQTPPRDGACVTYP